MGAASSEKEELGLKKGAWTVEEDQKLVSFIQKNNGHGSWRTVPQMAGLQRCGKSCRLRWTNYLRPDIKRGNFSAEEENTIARMHALLGNKWSTIASHLPGRTDNEVKNHWNTHMKKRLTRMGIDPASRIAHPLHHHHYRHRADWHPCPPPSAAYSSRSTPREFFADATAAAATRPLAPNFPLHAGDVLQQLIGLQNHHYKPRACTNPVSSRPAVAAPVSDHSFVSHMAQWEVARLEAEARLVATSKPSCSSARLDLIVPQFIPNVEPSGTSPASAKSASAVASIFGTAENSDGPAYSSALSCNRYVGPLPAGSQHTVVQAFPEQLCTAEYLCTSTPVREETSISLPSFDTSASSASEQNSASKLKIDGESYLTDDDELQQVRGGVGAAAATAINSGSNSSAGTTMDCSDNHVRYNRTPSTGGVHDLQQLVLLPEELLMQMSPTGLAGPSPGYVEAEVKAPNLNFEDLQMPASPNQSTESDSVYWAHLLNGFAAGPLSSCPS